MKGKTTINLWFMRRDELNAVVVIIKNGFSITVSFKQIIRRLKAGAGHLLQPIWKDMECNRKSVP